jgi:hypothetical protein
MTDDLNQQPEMEKERAALLQEATELMSIFGAILKKVSAG